MDDEVEDKIIYQTYMSHVRLLSKFTWGGGASSHLFVSSLQLHRIWRFEVILAAALIILIYVYMQALDHWSRGLLHKLQSSVLSNNKNASPVVVHCNESLATSATHLVATGKHQWSARSHQTAVFSAQGPRERMEDRHVICEAIPNTGGVKLYAVFDGHGGDMAANYAKDTLVPELCNRIRTVKEQSQTCAPDVEQHTIGRHEQLKRSMCKLASVDYYSQLLKDGILDGDQQVLRLLKKADSLAGTTALIAVLDGARLTVANLGDSRAVMCDARGVAIPLSFDHKPQQQRERRRIRDAGGTVTFNGVWRVCGVLAISRALGDYPLKARNLVIAEADVLTFDLAVHRPQFLLLATDGLWDTFSNEQAVAYVRRHWHEPDYGAKSIALETLKRGSEDNVTVIVVNLQKMTYYSSGGFSKVL